MDIITTHINADFDGLASMIAARKLYPNASLVFAGSTEPGLRKFLSQDLRNLYGFKKLKYLDLNAVTRLIVVDTRQPNRLDRLQECLDNPGLEIHLYDHHPNAPSDLQGNLERIENVGSTTTIFTRLFQEEQMEVSPDEATLMNIGIHEDTGSFLHSTTTPADLQAASWLLTKGAKLDIVNQFVRRELSAEQVSLLNKLLNNSKSYAINSIQITVSKMTLPTYADDFAVLVQRMMSMENLDVIFALICMGERLYLICRSRISEVNVGIIAREFGGGGHSSAASATIQHKTLFEAEEELFQILHRCIFPRAVAGEMMSSPVITATPDITHNEANDLLTRYNITVLPLVRDNADRKKPTGLLGVISRRGTAKAIAHKLGAVPVGEYMTTEIETLPKTAVLADIQKLIIEHRQRLIPITAEEVICGVITRTDLLNLLVNDPAHLPRNLLYGDEHPSTERTRNIRSLMTESLGKDIIILLRELGDIAHNISMRAYVVGGLVRDLLLQTKNLDIDIVIEGDGILFAQELARKKKASMRPHEKFATATVTLADGMRLDVATARLEYYAFPAAMPTVEHSSLKLDLSRRDFTINAMAIHLNPDRFGLLVDFFNSQNDLKEQRIRVLHNLSFVEDPTRIFRAVRFEQRLDFRITRHSEKLIRNAVQMHMFDKFSGSRFFIELRLILSEDNPLDSLRRMASFDLFSVLWPDLRPNLKVDRRFIHVMAQAERVISWFKLLYLPAKDRQCEFWSVRLLALFSRSRERELSNFCTRFELPPKQRKLLLRRKNQVEQIGAKMRQHSLMQASEIYWLLNDLDNEGLLYLMTIARKKYIQQAVSRYVTGLRTISPLISGRDLLEQGYPSGVLFRSIIDCVLEAQLNGKITTKDEALALIRKQYPLMQSLS
ncbi:MAG: CBS domain-containing protein [Candidatus Electrothrix sp. AR3]|nr:CBS domain-containing protein [Candidatus Electrothrix sp. AR3]